ncbi:MAG: GatB/YqeY domain-containing protein [Cytophagaceae bacterium]|nr:GatB/YqeY domain-containing protein [Cytophagaceae bacterium]
MSLKNQIESGIRQAMLAKDPDRLRALRAIKSMILNEETAPGATGGDLAPDAEMKLLSKAAKQRRDSADIFRQQNRADLLEKELSEIAVIEEFLPKQLSEADIKAKLQEIIARVGATGPGDMGKVMGTATKELAGQADGKIVSMLVKSMLS